MIVPNGGWDNSVDEIKEALDTLSYWLKEGATVIVIDEENGKCEKLKPFNPDTCFIM